MSRDLPRLLKRLARYRRAVRRRGLTRLLARQRKRALVAELAQAWPGGYVPTGDGMLAFIPAPLDRQGERVMFYGWSAHPAALAFAPPGGVAIDVGANLGEWSVPLATAVGPAGTVLAVEPNPIVADALSRTLRINHLAHAVVVSAALSDRDGDGVLHVEPADTGLSRLADGGGLPVILRRLDTIVVEARLARLDLVKIDVEGHERAVLAGAEAALRRFRPAIVFESGHETAGDRTVITTLLAELGYQLVAVLHDYGALACTEDDYRNATAACAGREARNILALPRLN